MSVKFCCAVILLFIGINCYAQNNLRGRVSNDNNKGIEGVNIILYSISSNEIITYTISDKTGNFKLFYANTNDSLRLEVSCIGFEKKTLNLANTLPSFLSVVLIPAVNNLKEIVIKENSTPISTKKDTINYNVKAFSDSSDRVVIDVIKKLPGITVTPTGQILYNNKAINKFYIEGKDLLENRYSIAGNNLPSNDVEQIQVIPNHQPIKLLDGELFSDRAAINIKLKKDAKLRLLGIGEIGAGIPASLREDDLALLKFTQNLQFINTIKSNNTGIDLDEELNEQNFSTDYYESTSSKEDLVSIVRPDNPPINQSRYWFNNNNLLNSNYLIRLNKTFDLKINAAFENDILSENPNSVTNIYLPKDTITIKENNIGKTTYSKLLTGLTLEANTKKVYLKNTLKLRQIWREENDFISSASIYQALNNPFTNLTNDLNAILKINDNIVGLKSYTTYSNLPQNLNITPGLYSDSLNSNRPFDGLLQRVQLKSFFSNTSASFGKKTGLFSFNNTAGILVQEQTLNNDLYKEQNNLTLPLADSFRNTIDRNKLKLYDNVGITFIKGTLNTTLSLKNSFNSLDSKSMQASQQLSRFFSNPELTIHYSINAYFENNITFSTSNNLNNNTNSSYILYDYRDFVNNDSPINQTDSKDISYGLVYKNIVRGIFASFNIIYSYNTSNILTYDTYDGILTTQNFIVQNNPSSNLNTSLNLSKYYDNIKTTINAGFDYSSTHLQEIQQGVFSEVKNDNYTVNTRIITNISDYVAVIHALNLSIYRNSITQNSNTIVYDPILSLKQDITLKIFFSNKIQTKFNIEQFYNDVSRTNHVNYFFADFILQKSLQKPKVDFSISLTNIFNAKSYTTYSYANNVFVSSNFPLRSRMLMFNVAFQF